jgi:ribosomal protein S18 acetylase RimI-like enzyme
MATDPGVEIRPAELWEAETIRDMVRAAYSKWIPVIDREPLPMKADYHKALREHQIDVVVEGGQIVGLIETMQHADHLWIENVAVVPSTQGRGIGRRLLAHAERRAMEAGCFEVRLLTNGAFKANLSLYGKLGYAVDRQESFMNGIAVHMSKRLPR